MVKDIKKAENKIKRLEKKGEDTADAEAELQSLNTEAEKMVDVQYLNNAEVPRQALSRHASES